MHRCQDLNGRYFLSIALRKYSAQRIYIIIIIIHIKEIIIKLICTNSTGMENIISLPGENVLTLDAKLLVYFDDFLGPSCKNCYQVFFLTK